MIGLVLVCCDEAESARPPSSHLDKRPALVECQPERRTAMYTYACATIGTEETRRNGSLPRD